MEEVRDRALRYSLENGVAFLHKTLSAGDQAAVRRCFASGAVQVRHSDDAPRTALMTQGPAAMADLKFMQASPCISCNSSGIRRCVDTAAVRPATAAEPRHTDHRSKLHSADTLLGAAP